MMTSKNADLSLTPYPLASFKELIALSFPLVLSCLSASLLGFFDRLFLSRYSLEAWTAVSTSSYIAYLFQMICSVIAMIAQSFIGQHIGARQPSKVGAITWQMIWFAFLSMLFTYPTSFIAELYFIGTEIESSALAYFRPIALFNFLFPLSAALTAFFVGQGKTRTIFYSSISIQLINICLDYLLIFGISPVIPPLGPFGAALATILAEFILCIILFFKFFSPNFISIYQTRRCRLDPLLFKKMLKVGIPRAIGRGMVISSWACGAYLLVKNGSTHLLVLTLGTSLITTFTFINEGIGQALTTVASHVLGANKGDAMPQLFRSAVLALSLALLFLSVPLIFIQESTIRIFITEPISSSTWFILKRTCTFTWIACLANAFNLIGTSLITASRDTLFYACLTLLNWATVCMPVYVIIGTFHCSPEYFFMIDSINAVFFGMIYILRFYKGVWKKKLHLLHQQSP